MEEMIAKLIEIDRHAREITENAVKEKLQAEKNIALEKQQLHDQYLERAKERLTRLEKEHRGLSENTFQENRKRYETASQTLLNLDQQHHGTWVDQLVQRTLA